MAARSIASLSISFGLVSIPVRVFSATESSASVSFNLLHKDCGSRLRQQYVCQREGVLVTREEMVKGYEFEKDRYVVFTKEELEALEAGAQHTIDIVSFMPEKAVDPIYYDKAYYLAPDRRGAKPYGLLAEAMRRTGTCALGKWSWKSKQYVVQIRPNEDGLVLQQLLYADEVRSMADLNIERSDVQPAELALAQQLIEQNTVDGYDAAAFRDEEKERVLAEIDRKIAGNAITVAESTEAAQATGGEVIDLMAALRASLQKRGATKAPARDSASPAAAAPPKKGARRAAAPAAAPAAEAVPAKRTRKKSA